jgi:hypothetical protein
MKAAMIDTPIPLANPITAFKLDPLPQALLRFYPLKLYDK